MKAYLYDNQDGDQRLPHYSGHDVSLDYLDRIGVLYYQISSEEKVDELARQRLYKNRDIITVSPENMGAAYNEKVQSFFHEHLHEDEEIRYIKDGAGYFDVRGENDEWVRIRMEKDDLIFVIDSMQFVNKVCYKILPAGIYHRFTTDESNSITAMRLFKEDPKWTPLNRGPDVDVNFFRQDYVHKLKAGAS